MTSPRELAHATDALTTALLDYALTDEAARQIAEAVAAGVESGEWETARILEDVALALHQQSLRRRVRE